MKITFLNSISLKIEILKKKTQMILWIYINQLFITKLKVGQKNKEKKERKKKWIKSQEKRQSPIPNPQ